MGGFAPRWYGLLGGAPQSTADISRPASLAEPAACRVDRRAAEHERITPEDRR